LTHVITALARTRLNIFARRAVAKFMRKIVHILDVRPGLVYFSDNIAV